MSTGETLTLRTSRGKYLGLALVGTAFAAFGYAVRAPDDTLWLAVTVPFALMAAGCIAVASRPGLLTLTDEGLSLRTAVFGKTGSVPWEECRDFRTMAVRGSRFVVYTRERREGAPPGGLGGAWRRANDSAAMVPGHFAGGGPVELAALLNEWRARSLGEQLPG